MNQPDNLTILDNYNETYCFSDLLPKSFLKKYIGTNPEWGFDGLGYIVYKRTYARKIDDDGLAEEWWQTLARCINGAQKIGAGYTPAEAQELFDLCFHLKCSLAGRMLWQLGTSTVDRFGANSLLNCWYVDITKPEDFLFIFENLMLGGGVGFSVRREDIHELPKIKPDVTITHNNEKDADFITPDSREGWVETLRRVLDAYFVTGKSFSYSTVLVRGAGEPIAGFGGTASGPGILSQGIEQISGVLKAREGKKLRSVDVLDICNIIGDVVVAGNVRRSAQIAIGDPDDYLYIRAKNWSTGNIPNWRSKSNNSLQADSYDAISEEVWNLGYVVDPRTGFAKGEPYGFLNLPLCQKYGRLSDPPLKKKDNCAGVNPCAEITLSSYECCNLVELFLNRIESPEELGRCALLLYKTQKAIAAMPFIHEETNKIVHKNMRLGMGVTGVTQAMDKLDWLDECYNKLRAFDKEWSKKRGWPESIKLTTVKPSGTLSLLAGSSPGCHRLYSEYFIRRVRVSSHDPLVELCEQMGYKIVWERKLDGTEDHTTKVIEFPCNSGGAAMTEDTGDVIEQLELVKKLQEVWSDNSVSVTAYYDPEDLDTLREWMSENYDKGLKTVSFLLRKEHGFALPPLEAIDEKEYQRLISKVKPLSEVATNNAGTEGLSGLECDGGACPVK
jgi:ribonucleoside-triphosphate reductase